MEAKKQNIVFNMKRKGFAVWLIVASLVFIFLILMIWFLFGKIKNGSDSLFLEKNKIAVLQKQIGDVESFKIKYNEYLPSLQKIDQAFVDPDNPLNFIEFLEKSAEDSNIELEISPLSFTVEGGLKILSLQLSSVGSFSGNLNFLEKLEKGPYLLYIEKLTLSEFRESKSSKTSSNKIQASVSTKILSK